MNQMQAVKKRKNQRYSVKASDYTIRALTEDMHTEFATETSITSAVTFSLPAATVGMGFKFRVGSAQELRIDPTTANTIALPSTGAQGGAGKYLTANAVGESVELECKIAGDWDVNNWVGTWAHQT